jgi:hypothetical protein
MPFDLATAIYCADLCKRSYDGDPAAFEKLLANVRSKAAGDLFSVIGEDRYGQTAVVLRGTATLGGWVTDLDARPVASNYFKGRVHDGFLRAFEELSPWLMATIGTADKLLVTGHSLGGALATLISQFLTEHRDLAPVYTFGSPRVGDSEFAASYRPEQWRVVGGLDIVPHVPSYPFVHVGTEYHLPEGKPRGLLATLSTLFRHASGGLGPLVIEAINDHAIERYLSGLAPIV